MTTSRWAASSAAALITVLTVAGALGLGPGAAMGETSRPRSLAAIAEVNDQGAEADEWLTIDKPPASDTEEFAVPGAPTSTALPAHSGSGRRIVFDESAQRVWLVDAGDQVVRTYLVSGAKDEDLLKPGSYHVYSKSRDAISYNLKETMNYMVRFTAGDNAAIGFHDLPARDDGSLVQSRDELGTPLSAGCVRQWVADAKALWKFAPVDTLVVVVP